MQNRHIITLTAAAAVLLALTACEPAENNADTKPTPTTKPPAYKVINEELKKNTGSTDLVIPKATVKQAKAAITDYASTLDKQLKNVSITVVRKPDDKVYVCSGEWVRDEKAAEIYTGGRVKAGRWPAIDMNCPDPAGS